MVLAAGRSTRMGRPKLLLPVAGAPMITRVVDAVLRSAVERTVVVVGREGEAIRAALAGRLAPTLEWVENTAAQAEMLDSLRLGLARFPATTGGFLVVLGDQPWLETGLIDHLIARWRAGPGNIVVPVHGGRRGHPLLFDAVFRAAVLEGLEGEGLRGLLRAHPEAIGELPWGDSSVLDDVDTPADYQRLRQ